MLYSIKKNPQSIRKLYINLIIIKLYGRTKTRKGKYEYYKGKQYKVIGLARHSETLEELVICKALYNSEEFGNNALWARPKEMFLETVNADGKEVPRFKFLE